MVNKQLEYTYSPISQEVKATEQWNLSVNRIHSVFYKHTGKLGWNTICLRFFKFELEIMLDGMLNFKTHFMAWYFFFLYIIYYSLAKAT